VLADALQHPAFPPDQIEKARADGITQVQIADNNTSSVASRVANEILYPKGHPYHRPSIGDAASLAAVTREDLTAFHARHYGPNQTTLVLVGDVDPAKTLEQVKRAFGGWKKLDAPPPFSVPEVAAPKAAVRKTVAMPGKSQADAVLALPGIARTAPDYYPTMVMNYILGGGSLSSRLMDNLRDKQGLVYGVYSYLTPGIGAGPIQMRAGSNPANVERAAAAMLEQVKRMHDEGPTSEELEDAKGYLTGVFPVRLETNAGVAAQLLGAEMYGLGMDYIQRYASIIRSVTLEQVRAAAKDHLRPDAPVVVVAGTVEEGKRP
jgi:zinc protease